MIPLDRLDRQLTCRVCGSAFYLDPYRQEFVLGNRPKEFIDPLKLQPPQKLGRSFPNFSISNGRNSANRAAA